VRHAGILFTVEYESSRRFEWSRGNAKNLSVDKGIIILVYCGKWLIKQRMISPFLPHAQITH